MDSKLLKNIIVAVSVVMFVYHLANTQYILWRSPISHQNIHLLLALLVVFLHFLKEAPRKRLLPALICIAVAAIGATYIQVHLPELEMRAGTAIPADIPIAVMMVAVCLVAAYFAFGLTIPVLAVVFVAYMIYGHNLPGFLGHGVVPFDLAMSKLVTGVNGGIYGTFMDTSANLIFLYIVFGGLLGSDLLISFVAELGKIICRVFRGGVLMTAAVSSALVGMATGSTPANVATTGSFTIPLMKRHGVEPSIAGASESAASAGGQIMPPVMGAAAFLMAGLIGVPYRTVMIAAIVTAVLYFVGIAVFQEVYARKIGLMPVFQDIDKEVLLKGAVVFFGPLIVLIVLLLGGLGPGYVVFWSIMVLVALNLIIDRESFVKRFFSSVESGVKGAADIAVTSAVIGLVYTSTMATGLGMKFAMLIETLSGGSVIVGLLVAAVVILFFGAALPTMAAYGLAVVMLSFFLAGLDIPVLQVHFFVLLVAALAPITPPIGLGSMMAQKISGGEYWKVGGWGLLFASGGILAACGVVFHPILVTNFSAPLLDSICTVLAVFLGTLALACGSVNYLFAPLSIWQRILAFASCACFTVELVTTATTSFIAFGLGLVMLAAVHIANNRNASCPGGVLAPRE